MSKSQHGFPNLVRAKYMSLVRSITQARAQFTAGRSFTVSVPAGFTLGSTATAVLEVQLIGGSTYRIRAMGPGTASLLATGPYAFSLGMFVTVVP